MTTFSDIFKSSFLSNTTSVSMLDMVIALVLAFCIGLLIFFVYTKTYQGVMYSSSFGVSLVALTLVSTLVILAVTSNVVLSLGMVGALSIVRFRTAIKEPLDIVYLFWAIGAGIVLAAGLILLGVFGSIFIAIILLVFTNRKTYIRPYIAVISLNDIKGEKYVYEFLSKNSKKVILKTKTLRDGLDELTYELRLNSNNTSFVNEISNLEFVNNITLVTYNGEYM